MDDENDIWSIEIPEPVERSIDEKVELFINIINKLDLRKPVSEKPSGPCIGLVPKHLRYVNAKAYEPQVIVIGPYHHDKRHLKVMEEHKRRYLKMLLQRKGEDDVNRYVKTLGKLEEKARACYADPICLRGNEFVEMLLLDACFIVELFRRDYKAVPDCHPNFYSGGMAKILCRDLLLAENQIPFFVLDAFFRRTATPEETDFLTMIFSFFDSHLLYQYHKENPSDFFEIKKTKHKHLLSVVHDRWVYGVALERPISGTRKSKNSSLLRKKDDSDEGDCESNRFATDLREAGIKFSKVEGKSLFDIKFENGIMKIPRLTIDEDTESLFLNLIVYEQFLPKKLNPFVDYMNFIGSLINSEKDVKLLCQRKILCNCLGNDKVVAKMFNRLGDSVILSAFDRYTSIYENVNKHCDNRWNKWIANLMDNYFNTPWAFISFLAAVLLLLLTLAQTVFSILAYFK